MEKKETNKHQSTPEQRVDIDYSWSSWAGSGSLLPGLVLITLGVIFLLNKLTGFELDNWWALFILIPAVNNLSSALAIYRKSGQFGRGVRSRLFFALFFTLLAAVFLINLNFELIWPAFLILAGIGVLFGAL